MTRVRSSAPSPPPKNVTPAASVSTASKASSTSDAKKAKQEEVQKQKPLPESKKSQRRHEKRMSGAMKKAAYDKTLKDKAATSKPAATATGAKTAAPSAAPAASAATAATSASPTATVPVKVNVLAHTPAGGSLKTIGDSPQERLKFFDQMCAKAHAGIPTSKLASGEKQMNVMVAPEWLFAKRSDPNNRAYTGKDMQEITEGLQQISKKYPDMLIVPGSVSWEIPDKTDPKKTIMYNSTPVVQGGKIVHMYHKRNEGGETGGQLERWGMGRPEIRDKVESFNTAFFEHKGVNFSLEMCADQAGAQSRKEYASKFPNGKGTDVHILISEGSKLQPSMTPVKNGGLVVHVDGSGDGLSKVGTIQRPDITISEWMDAIDRPKVDAQFATANPLSDARTAQHERMMLFSDLTVKVPKKDE